MLHKIYLAKNSCVQQTNNGPPAWQAANTPYRTKLTCYGIEQTDRHRPRSLEWLFKSYDDTGTDKGSQHTKILAELIQPGGRTIHYEILELINSIWNREENLLPLLNCHNSPFPTDHQFQLQ